LRGPGQDPPADLGIVGSGLFHIRWADGAASLAIRLLLTGVAAVLANETRSLIAGEVVAPPVMERLQTVLRADPRIIEIVEIATLHLGPRAILVALTLSFQPDMSVAGLGEAIGELTDAMHRADGRVTYVSDRPG
jgi:divalent metal cation (Fe/Co/Zn/Cd) transporter